MVRVIDELDPGAVPGASTNKTTGAKQDRQALKGVTFRSV